MAIASVPISGMSPVITPLGTDKLADAQVGAPITRSLTLDQIKVFVGTAASYGEMGFIGNSTGTPVTVGLSAVIEGTYVDGELVDFTFASNRLTYVGTQTRKFLVCLAGTVSLDLGTGDVGLLIAKNSVIEAQSQQTVSVDNVSPSFQGVSTFQMIELNQNDYIEAHTVNESNNLDVFFQDLRVQVFAVSVAATPPSGSGQLFAQTNTVTVQNTAAETQLSGTGVGAMSFGANTLVAGDSYSFIVAGEYSTLSALPGDTVHFRLKSGTVLLFDSGPMTINAALTLRGYSLKATTTVQAIGAAGVARVHTLMDFGAMTAIPSLGQNMYVDSTNFDTTTPLVFTLTAEWNIANANNSISSEVLTLSQI
jgi:hypothetical protein